MNEHLRKDEEAIKVKYCAKCKNHGRKEEMKGHKRECARRHCSCDKCQGTEKKRAKTRIQVQLRRIKLLNMEKAAKVSHEMKARRFRWAGHVARSNPSGSLNITMNNNKEKEM
ncbi:unnamed protein product [Nezara viridula]|uniref:DM domain-containing protein n=1 Tax=Nezara viridula TaxID=85310 RepID=A0A9P0EFC7_NEZVI|nr:unnamed protein product [Nezara viridula]